MERPDLSNIDPKVREYIDYLEEQLKSQDARKSRSARSSYDTGAEEVNEAPLPGEPPTTINIITASSEGIAKRTPRHLYTPQHRGGMGVFDLDLPEPKFPTILSSVDEDQNVLLFTNHARVFRYPLNRIPTAPIHSKGQQILDPLSLEPDETLVGILPEQAHGYVVLASQRGRVRSLRHHLFGEHMRPGTAMFPYKDFGLLASVSWTSGDSDLFIVTENGMGIRFAEKVLPPQGDWGIRLSEGDRVVAVTEVYADSGVFILSADGKGTIRQMAGFAPNKSAGGAGKLAIRSDKVAGAVAVNENDSLFITTRQGKIIRFRADEVPPTGGVVQGVNCISMRSDEATALTASGLSHI